MSSRSATVLVIFIVACIAFCLASVFAAMTGPISILPNESESGGILDNLSAITDSDNNYPSYGSDDSQSEGSQIETTVDDSSSDDSKPSDDSETPAQPPTESSQGSNNPKNST